jgi:hypothetical protein
MWGWAGCWLELIVWRHCTAMRHMDVYDRNGKFCQSAKRCRVKFADRSFNPSMGLRRSDPRVGFGYSTVPAKKLPGRKKGLGAAAEM